MILKCPFCSYPYLVENEGKYQCGVCGSKYYYVSGQVMMSEGVNRYGAGGLIVGRYRVIGELYPETTEVFYSCIDEITGKMVCLKDLRPEEGYVPVNLSRFEVIGEIDLPHGGFKTIKLPEDGAAPLAPTAVPALSCEKELVVPPELPGVIPENGATAEKKKSGKAWKIIFWVLLVLILAGGGGFVAYKGYWRTWVNYFRPGTFQTAGSTEKDKVPAEKTPAETPAEKSGISK